MQGEFDSIDPHTLAKELNRIYFHNLTQFNTFTKLQNLVNVLVFAVNGIWYHIYFTIWSILTNSPSVYQIHNLLVTSY